MFSSTTRTMMLAPRILLLFALTLVSAPSARADWLPADLPFREYLGEPVHGLAPAGEDDLWAVSPYAYRHLDDQHVRWNSLAYRSLNGGRLWDLPWDAPAGATEPNSAPFQDTQLFAASFADRDAGFLFGWQRPTFGLSDPPGQYSFYRTTDRGRTWTVSTLPNGTASASEDPDFAIDALDAARAIAVQGRRVFETMDGAAWRERAGSFPRMFALQARGLPSPRVAGSDNGKAVAGTLTPNGFTADLTADGEFRALHFADATHGWVAGGTETSGTIYGTSDGGRTWTLQASVPGVRFRGLAAVDADRAWAAGERLDTTRESADRGVIFRTEDAGKTWVLALATPDRLVSLAFRDAYHGWAGGDDGVYRYVPPLEVPAGDLDRNGQVDRTDVANVLNFVAGLRVAGGDDLRAAGATGRVSVADAVAALRGVMALRSEPLPSTGARAVVVYNTLAPDGDGNGVGDSEEVARYYAERRGVPETNLVPIAWADTAYFQNSRVGRENWSDAYKTIVGPLRARLAAIGRESVDTLVFTYGVPFAFVVSAPDGTQERVTLDSAVQDLYAVDAESWVSENPYAAPFGTVAERYGRLPYVAKSRPMGQPVADAQGVVARGPYYLAGRIDGPSVEIVKAMVDNALFAERHYAPGGYEGVAYIDHRAGQYNLPTLQPYSLDELRAFDPRYTNYATYDRSIARTLLTFHDRGLPWRDEVTNASIGAPPAEGTAAFRDGTPARSAPRAMFYAGWYNYGRYYDVFEWLPGSVGIDFDSASAAYFREDRFFAGGALNAGLSALVGVIDEPYSYHPKPDALMEYLARGFRYGEAAALANDTPRLARALSLGDPLYRPFGSVPVRAVPVPTLHVSATRAPGGWTVSLTSDVPVRATLRHAYSGEPGQDSPTVSSVLPFYALRHTFTVPDGAMRAVVEAIDPTGRVTASPTVPLS